jgi:hypothetical protein
MDLTPAWNLGEGLTTPHRKNPNSYQMLRRSSDLDRFSGTTYATENGYDILNMECCSFYKAGSLKIPSKGTGEV